MIVVIAYTFLNSTIQENRAWDEATNAHQQNAFFLMQIADLLMGLLALIFFAAIYIKKALETSTDEKRKSGPD